MDARTGTSEGPLAEYASMRQEIESCIDRMTRLYLFQLSTAGAIFAFVLSGGGRSGLLLIVPISSYLLYVAWLNNYESVMHIGKFIDTVLGPKIGGGVHWESWRRANPYPQRLPGGYHHLLLAFAGVSLLSLGWATPTVFSGWSAAPWVHVALLAAWLVGLGALLAQAYLSRDRW
ncbi:MAG: hypothetical protein ACRDT6_10890 [Micromonosporaceae bacterium]